MRALPQIDTHPQSAPVQADAPARGRGESENFAETLQRSSESKQSCERPTERPGDKPEKIAAPEKPSAEKSAEDSAPTKPEQPTSTKDLVASDEAQAPSDDTIVDPMIAALLVAPLVPVVAPQNTTPTALADLDLLAASAAPTDDGLLTALAAPSTESVAAPATPAVAAPIIPAASALQAAVPEKIAQPVVAPPTASAALTAAPAMVAAPTADATLLASAAPALPVTAAQPTAKPSESVLPIVADAAAAITEVDPSSVLPPVLAGEKTAKTELLSQPADAMTVDDAAVHLAPLPSAATLTSATPATQSTGMHTVAAAIGDHGKKEIPQDNTAVTVKSTGDLAVPTTSQQPTAPVTATRPMSETVLAQNTLAEQGNAMEKAVAHQVSKALVQHLPNGDRMMVLRLTPPELGTVKVELIERQGVLSARLHAEDDGVRLALERFLPSMRQDLRASDAPIRELDLSDQAQFQRSFADGQQGQEQDANRSGNRRSRDDAPRFSIDGVRSEPVAVPRAAPLGGRVDLSGVDAVA